MDYTINNYRSRRIGDKYFVTTDSGSWIVLERNEFNKLRNNNIDDDLYKKLTEREIVLDEENIQEYIRDLARRNSFLFQGTSLHIIVATLRCNMKCVYCHASSVDKDKNEFDMSMETAKKTVDFIFQSPNPDITIEFQGGEPLLNWDVVKYIIKYSKEKAQNEKRKLGLTLVTNFSLMDDEKMNYLVQEQIPVCTSLDGPKELHDKNRIFSEGGNYDQVVSWIKKFNEAYKKNGHHNLSVHALVTLTKASMKYPDEIVDEYIKLGLKEIHLRFLNNLGFAKKASEMIRYPAKEYLDFWDNAMKRIKFHQDNGVNLKERMVEIIAHKIGTKFDPNYLDLRSPCGAAIGQLVYQYDGGIYTCDEGRMTGDDSFLLGNVFDNNYKSIISCDKACAVINASINDQFICDTCAYKPYCGLCPVCSFADDGNIISKISKSERCKIFKHQFDSVVTERFINKN